MKNISQVHNCYGCGVCSKACGKSLIHMRLNDDGFYEPHITDFDKCVNCGMCVSVCSYLHEDIANESKPLESFGGWSNEHAVRRKCSSGGVGFEIGRYLIEQGYKVCAVRYNAESERTEHYIASTIEELIQSAGSKYMQSYTMDALLQLDRKQKYLVTGTPCQIDSFRRYIRKFRCEENFVLLDFFCHGVPSAFAWKRYCQMQEKKVGKIVYASWRNKQAGWHDSWAVGIDGIEKGEPIDWHDGYNLLIKGKKSFVNSRYTKGDLYYKLFLGDFCTNPACHNKCKFKYDKSSADIRIGDAWGETYKENEDGVTSTVAFTDRGKSILEKVNCTFEPHSFAVAAEGQMKVNSQKSPLADIVMFMLKHDLNLQVVKYVVKLDYLIRKLKKVIRL